MTESEKSKVSAPKPVKVVIRSLSSDESAIRSLKDLVNHPLFEFIFGMLIIANTIVMAMEAQYRGVDNGYNMEYPNYDEAAATRWPSGAKVFPILGYVFGFLFTVELLTKLAALRVQFFCNLWNLFDAVVIAFWLANNVFQANLWLNPTFLRLLRLARVMRMFQLVKHMQFLDTLQLLISSIKASAPILIWSTLILMMIMVTAAMILNHLLVDYAEDSEHPGQVRIYMYFGTFSRSMLTMFEVTLGNWVPVCRMLVEEVDETYAGFFVLYKITVGFAVVKVITGVFLRETFKVAASDDELMIMEKERLIEKHTNKMHQLFVESDTSGDGLLSIAEFREIVSDRRVKSWLAAMDLDVSDTETLFQLMDSVDHSQSLTANELVKGVSKLKGPARSIDVNVLMKKVQDALDALPSTHWPAQVLDDGAVLRELAALRREVSSLGRLEAPHAPQPAQAPQAPQPLHWERSLEHNQAAPASAPRVSSLERRMVFSPERSQILTVTEPHRSARTLRSHQSTQPSPRPVGADPWDVSLRLHATVPPAQLAPPACHI